MSQFIVKIPLTNEHLFYNYFFHLSVGNMFVTYVRNRPYCVIYLEKSGEIFDNRKKVNLPLIEI